MHVIDSLAVGGAERMLVDIANASLADGHRVSATVTRSAVDLVSDLHPDIMVTVLKRQKRFDWDAFQRLARVIEHSQVDVLHIHSLSTIALLALLRSLGLIGSVPFLMHFHSSDPGVPFWFRVWAKHFVTQFVGVSPSSHLWARSAGLADNRIHQIGNGLNLKRLANAASINVRHDLSISSAPVLGISVNGIRFEKGIDVLLQSLNLLSTEIPFHLIIVGGSRDRDYFEGCQQQCDTLGLSDRVSFLGERSDIPTLLKSVDFGVISSRSESGPLTLIEMLAAGLPFVSTLTGDVAHKVAAMHLLQFVPPGNAAALADALETLLELSVEERRKRSVASRQAAEQFDIRQRMPDWYRVYKLAQDAG